MHTKRLSSQAVSEVSRHNSPLIILGERQELSVVEEDRSVHPGDVPAQRGCQEGKEVHPRVIHLDFVEDEAVRAVKVEEGGEARDELLSGQKGWAVDGGEEVGPRKEGQVKAMKEGYTRVEDE